jgi:hypothetical protein
MTATAAAASASPSRGVPPWIIVMALFMVVVGIVNGIFVWLSSKGHRDLVRDDYYQVSLKQDSVIAMTAGAGRVSFRREGGEWTVENEAGAAPATGCRVRLYRPDDGSADREVRLEKAPAPAGREAWRAKAPSLRRGHWVATLVWDRDGADVRGTALNLTEP